MSNGVRSAFAGYRRADGRCGVRNHVPVLGAAGAVREDLAAAADRLHALLLGLCSGTRTFGEMLGEGGESRVRAGVSR